MGRERQKRKNRSGISKVVQRPKSKKQVFNNAIIAANWDKSETLSQNYKRLGLAVKLNKQSGGVEKDKANIGRQEEAAIQSDSLTIRPSTDRSAFGIEETRVERDPDGRILRVISTAQKTKANPLNDPLQDLDSDSDDAPEWAGLDNQHGNVSASAVSRPALTETVQELERRAAMPAAKYKRRQTDNERAFVEELVRKYGSDYEKMSRDTKINYMQRSAGDLKQRIKKCCTS